MCPLVYFPSLYMFNRNVGTDVTEIMYIMLVDALALQQNPIAT